MCRGRRATVVLRWCNGGATVVLQRRRTGVQGVEQELSDPGALHVPAGQAVRLRGGGQRSLGHLQGSLRHRPRDFCCTQLPRCPSLAPQFQKQLSG